MGRFGFGIIAILAFIALLTGLCELLFHRALKMHPAMRDLLAKMAQARRRDFSFFCQPLRLRRKPSASRRSLLRKPCRNAMPSRTGKISNIIFKKWFAREPNAGIPWRWDTMRHGAAGLLLAERLRQLRPASLFTAVNRPFSLSAIGWSSSTNGRITTSRRYTTSATGALF